VRWRLRPSGRCLPVTFEKGQQRTWNNIPYRNCMWDQTIEQLCFGTIKTTTVEMRNTCQVTNQSSHGELSFHHNPHLRLCWGLRLSTLRVIRSGGARLKHAAHPICCHCCELCALKQKPGVLLEKVFSKKTQKTNTKSQLQTVLITASGLQGEQPLANGTM